MNAMRTVLILGLVLSVVTGCGTFIARTPWREECGGLTRVYPATWVDYDLAVRRGIVDHYETGSRVPERLGNVCVGVLDTPISLVTDTLCLPVDLYSLLFGDQRAVVYPGDREDWARQPAAKD